MKKEFSEIMQKIGTNIRKLREERDVKQIDLSASIGISTVTLSKIENGSDCSILLLEKISKHLNINLHDLIPNNSNSFTFNNSPNSNGNLYNNFNENMLDIIRKENEHNNIIIEKLINLIDKNK